MMTSGQQIFLDKDEVYPGDTVTAEITILSPDLFLNQLDEGQEFDFREGSVIIGTGEILEVVNEKLKKTTANKS